MLRTIRIKNIYPLLFIGVTHLGCSSSYRYQMETGDTSVQSSSKKEGEHSVPQRGTNTQLDEKIKKFLDKEDFEKGSPVTNEELDLVINKLGRTVDMFNMSSIDKEYKAFLNKYGSIDGGGFEIYGPTVHTGDNEKRIQYISSIQRGFENRCRTSKMKAAQIKSCWLIAGIDQGDEYYINLSGKKKENIYSISPDGKSKLFAKDFLEFLDKFFESYERKFEEETYQGEVYQEEGSDSD
ncbi:SMI1/KNR4 family protein [Cardinium endosymbiont of Sogatella furcifera]|uniref:SMI1/KNR4 family protein n=1 Tax=Cardinium endosymbiont of Sogatella furcifera TaxID=650378 RepID=UPI0013B3BA8D|nr:SMI1/KNR4 family protein [Cardinium endosymbiont of Sogatella furcifera]